jgi:hypothetical protein
VDAIIQLVLLLISVWVAYSVAVAAKSHLWTGTASLGIYLAAFGAASYGLLNLWEYFRPKLVDDLPGEGTLLFVGLVTLAALVVMALDLMGMVDIMGKVRQSVNRPDMGRPAAPSGDD